jgi:hypothetical protein
MSGTAADPIPTAILTFLLQCLGLLSLISSAACRRSVVFASSSCLGITASRELVRSSILISHTIAPPLNLGFPFLQMDKGILPIQSEILVVLGRNPDPDDTGLIDDHIRVDRSESYLAGRGLGAALQLLNRRHRMRDDIRLLYRLFGTAGQYEQATYC